MSTLRIEMDRGRGWELRSEGDCQVTIEDDQETGVPSGEVVSTQQAYHPRLQATG